MMLSVSAGSDDVRIMKEAESLARIGLNVTVVGRKLPGFSNEDLVNGVKVLRAEKFKGLRSFFYKYREAKKLRKQIPLIERFSIILVRLYLMLSRTGGEPTSALSEDAVKEHSSSTSQPKTMSAKLSIDSTIDPTKKKTRDQFNLIERVSHRVRGAFVHYTTYFASYFVTSEEYLEKIVAEAPDVIHAHDLYTLPAAVRASEIVKAKVVYDAHEYERYRRPTMNFIHRYFVGWLEKTYKNSVSEYIMVSQSIAEAMTKHLEIPLPTVVYNSPPTVAFERSDFKIQTGALSLRSFLGLGEDVPLAVNVGKYFNLDKQDHKVKPVIEALKYAPEVHLAILGYKAPGVKEEIVATAEEFGVGKRVHCIDPLPYFQVCDFIKSADLGVFVLPAVCLNGEYAMPNKIFEMTLSGLPIVSVATKDAKRYIEKTRSGITVDRWDPEALSEAIIYVLEHKKLFRKSETDLSVLRRSYGWEAQLHKIVSLYEKLGVRVPRSTYRNQLEDYLNGNISPNFKFSGADFLAPTAKDSSRIGIGVT